MENPFTGAAPGPEAAFAGAAERFFELLKTFGVPAAGQPHNWSSLAAPLAGQFEQWLRMSQAAGPWLAAGAAFGPLPLGPAAAQAGEAQRSWELLRRLAQLQTQLAAHWSEIANGAAQRFTARAANAALAPATPEQAMKLYELWVNCAEEAYAATVHREDFARLQAELANTAAAILVEQRRHAETLVRAFGLPTRNEIDALYAQLKDLRRQLAELGEAARRSGARAAEEGARTDKAGARQGPRAAPRRRDGQGPRRRAGGRARARRPRA